MQKFQEIGHALSESVGFSYECAIATFLQEKIGTTQKTGPGAFIGKFQLHSEDGIWHAWSRVIGGNLMVYCEAPGGIVYDRAFPITTGEVHKHGYIPPDCGHKVPARHTDFDDGMLPPTEPLD